MKKTICYEMSFHYMKQGAEKQGSIKINKNFHVDSDVEANDRAPWQPDDKQVERAVKASWAENKVKGCEFLSAGDVLSSSIF